MRWSGEAYNATEIIAFSFNTFTLGAYTSNIFIKPISSPFWWQKYHRSCVRCRCWRVRADEGTLWIWKQRVGILFIAYSIRSNTLCTYPYSSVLLVYTILKQAALIIISIYPLAVCLSPHNQYRHVMHGVMRCVVFHCWLGTSAVSDNWLRFARHICAYMITDGES